MPEVSVDTTELKCDGGAQSSAFLPGALVLVRETEFFPATYQLRVAG